MTYKINNLIELRSTNQITEISAPLTNTVVYVSGNLIPYLIYTFKLFLKFCHNICISFFVEVQHIFSVLLSTLCGLVFERQDA